MVLKLSHSTLLLVAVMTLVVSVSDAAHLNTAVTTIRTPNGGVVPEVVLDNIGVLHMTYGQGGDGFYIQSRDGGKSFSQALQLNRQAGTVTVGGERGLRLALGKDNAIHVVWMGHYQRGGGVWYTRSIDGGRTFEPERNLLDTTTGIDSVTVAADRTGNVSVFWLDGRLPEDPNSPYTSPIFMARSTDGGATFSRNQQVKHDEPRRACACCRLEARAGEDGYLYLVFRSGFQSIRDFYLLRGLTTENNFRSMRVSVDDWKLDACPMSGASLNVREGGRVFVSWMSRGKVYWSALNDVAKSFAARTATPDGEGVENYSTILTNRKGEVWLVWRQGGQVQWARYTKDGKLTGERGTAGTMTNRNKHTAFIGNDDNLVVVM